MDNARFVKLNCSETGLVKLTVEFDGDNFPTDVEFHITELKDFLYEVNKYERDNNLTEDVISEDDEITDICIKDDAWKRFSCIQVTFQNKNKELIFETNEEFFVDFLEL